MKRLLSGLAVLALLTACGGSSGAPVANPGLVASAQSRPPSVAETAGAPSSQAPSGEAQRGSADIASNLEVPWGVGFLPGGDALVTERMTGRVLRLVNGQTRTLTTLDVAARGEGGLLGLAVSPSYAADHLVYVYYTAADDNRLVRFTVDGDRVGPVQPVLVGIPKGVIHDGGRIAFGPDGLLYVGTGETGQSDLAQDRGSLAGKILRVRSDGSVPADNPFPGSPVWSYGHRNVQGLGWDSAGRMYATEFGPDRDDEINLIRPGANYGWPTVTGKAGDPRFVDPLVTFPPSQNSASGLVVTDTALYTAALRGERLWVIPHQADGSLGKPAARLVGQYGRLRTPVLTPDKRLWVTTSNRDGRGSPSENDDRILDVPVLADPQ